MTNPVAGPKEMVSVNLDARTRCLSHLHKRPQKTLHTREMGAIFVLARQPTDQQRQEETNVNTDIFILNVYNIFGPVEQDGAGICERVIYRSTFSALD